MKGKELLLIAISSFVLTSIWIASNVYHSYATSTIDTLLKIQILPVSPTFDSATIEKLKLRHAIEPVTTSFTPTTPTPTLSPSPGAVTIEEIPVSPPEQELVIPSVTPTPTEEVVSTSVTPTP